MNDIEIIPFTLDGLIRELQKQREIFGGAFGVAPVFVRFPNGVTAPITSVPSWCICSDVLFPCKVIFKFDNPR